MYQKNKRNQSKSKISNRIKILSILSICTHLLTYNQFRTNKNIKTSSTIIYDLIKLKEENDRATSIDND